MSTLKDINTKTADFDLSNGLREKIDFFQSETTASLVLNFKNKGEKFDLTNISSIKAYMVKPDNTTCFVNGEVVNAVEGTVKFELTNNILAVPGNIATTLIMYEGETDNKLYQKFNIKCKDTDYDEEAVESTNEFSALQEALEQAQTGGVGVDKVKQIIKGLIADGELEVQAYDDTAIKNDITTLQGKAHTHTNSSVLDELTDSSGKLQYKGSDISSGGGSSTGGGIDFLTDAEMDAIETEIFG